MKPYEPGPEEGPSMTYPQPWKRLPSPPRPPIRNHERVRRNHVAMRRCIQMLFVVLVSALAFSHGLMLR